MGNNKLDGLDLNEAGGDERAEASPMPSNLYAEEARSSKAPSKDPALNLPSNPPRGVLQEIPRGWIRKQVTTCKGPRIFYYNTMGKKFSNIEEVRQYFQRLGQSVTPGLFNFDTEKRNLDGEANLSVVSNGNQGSILQNSISAENFSD
jgi:hypothetical protein